MIDVLLASQDTNQAQDGLSSWLKSKRRLRNTYVELNSIITGSTLELRLIQTAYLSRTQYGKPGVNDLHLEWS